MPKMTKKGISPKEIVYLADCKVCGSEHEYTKGEPGVSRESGGYGGSDYYTFPCQVCESTVVAYGNKSKP